MRVACSECIFLSLARLVNLNFEEFIGECRKKDQEGMKKTRTAKRVGGIAWHGQKEKVETTDVVSTFRNEPPRTRTGHPLLKRQML